jgi:hypothetical protein
MKKTLLVVALFFVANLSVVGAADSEWYWISIPSDPDTGYFLEEVSPNTIGYTETDSSSGENRTIAPEDFMGTMEDVEEFSGCSNGLDSAIKKLRNFDSDEDLVISNYKCPGYSDCGPYYVTGATKDREKLLNNIEDDAEQCIEGEKIKEERAEEAREQKKEEEKRLKEIEEAVEECDFDFFEKMTSSERMDIYKERMSCKEEVDDPEAVAEIITPVVVSAPTPVESVVAQYVPPTPPVVVSSVPERVEVKEETAISTTTDSEATTTEDVIAVTQEGLDRIVEERLSEKLEEIQGEPELTPELKPTFIKRVTNFLFGWMF